MFYDRQIKYFTYKKNGERICSAGYVKLEVRNGSCNLGIHISGLRKEDSFTRMVLLRSASCEESLASIDLKAGSGKLVLQLKPEFLTSHISYEQLEEIIIPVSPGCELHCEIKPAQRAIKKRQEESMIEEESEIRKEVAKREERGMEENASPLPYESSEIDTSISIPSHIQVTSIPKMHEIDSTNCMEVIKGVENMQNGTQEDSTHDENVCVFEHAGKDVNKEDNREEKITSTEKLEEKKDCQKKEDFLKNNNDKDKDNYENQESYKPLKLMEDKWRQLVAIYPQIAPFDDERKYLRMGPQDFVVLASKYYKLVQNSFLLHGYYNYKHVILTRQENRGEIKYYIGVPGNFYDREKQVALMFGFQSFECKEEPAKQGDYGYYMIRVEL